MDRQRPRRRYGRAIIQSSILMSSVNVDAWTQPTWAHLTVSFRGPNSAGAFNSIQGRTKSPCAHPAETTTGTRQVKGSLSLLRPPPLAPPIRHGPTTLKACGIHLPGPPSNQLAGCAALPHGTNSPVGNVLAEVSRATIAGYAGTDVLALARGGPMTG